MTDRIYYTYAYLREDGTPYYIGRGKGGRAFDVTHRIKVPPKDRVLFLKQNLTYEEASRHEIYMIAVLGRRDLGTGILRNLTNGGEGRPGPKPQEEVEKIRKANTGKVMPDGVRQKISKTKMGVPVHSKEHREKLRNQFTTQNPNADGSAVRGKQVWNNGSINRHFDGDPGPGWVLGKIGGGFHGKHTEENRKRFSEDRKKRRHWVNKEGKTKFQETCPGEGWQPGRKWRAEP
jgi:hypothetical protein